MRQELQSKNMSEKMVAAQKLLFVINENTCLLGMAGAKTSQAEELQWAVFNIIELMGSQLKFE